ncbi:GNAT family N-acetyltransferase [Burkholderia sp. Ac-20365]|nr:GNAT family N-acetyltransferase [Burkholderia sp. Ac-20365]
MRLAVDSDAGQLAAVDQLAACEPRRKELIEQSIADGQCWVATRADDPMTVLGFGILNRSFFHQHFVQLLIVHENQRRLGIATTILLALETQCRGSKLFTSTNASNAPMRALLARAGYKPSGWIDNLDADDPELIFLKFIPG